MKRIKKLKISTKLLTGFSILIVFTIFNGVVGSRGIQQINYQEKISELTDSCLTDFQDAQLAVEKYIYSQNESHIYSVEEGINAVLTQANTAENLMLKEENKIHTEALIHSISEYRDLNRQLIGNQNTLNIYYERIMSESEIIISDVISLLSYAEGSLEEELILSEDLSNSVAILYGLRNLRNDANSFQFDVLRIHKRLSQEEMEMLFTDVNLKMDQMKKDLLDSKKKISNLQILSSLEDFLGSLKKYEVILDEYKNKSLHQSDIRALQGHESDNIMLSIINIRDNVDNNIAKIINHHNKITLLLSILSTLIGVFLALLLTKSITQQLGAEPYEIEEVSSKISQGNFNVIFPEGKLSGVFLSLKDMMDKLAITTASKDELELEIQKRLIEETKYQNLFDTMTEGFATHEIIVDETGKPVDYKFKSLNPSYEKIVGVKASDIVEKNVLEVFPDLEPHWIERYGKVALTGKPIQFEDYSHTFKRYFNISAFCPVKGKFAVSFSDITDRVLAEKELQKKHEILSITLRSIGDGVITTDPKGNITFINPVTEELTGWTNEEAFGNPLEKVFHIVHEETNDRCENPALKVLNTGRIIELANHTCLISKKGDLYVIEDSAAPIRDKEQNILGVIIVFRDTTEKKKLNESMQNNERLESLGVLAGGIAHDFNNYLAGIFGYVELAKNNLRSENTEKSMGYLLKVLKISERAKSLTHQLLTFAKGGKPNKELTNLEDLIQTSVLFALSGTRVVSHLNIDKNLWACHCDKNRISQCIDNLVINAVQAMQESGTLSFSARNAQNLPAPLRGNAYIEMKIEDTGSGVPASIREKIFDPFFSTKKEGNGLGLATVYSIIKNHDGWIELESEIGVGSAFTFYLPATRSVKPLINETKIDYKAGSGHVLILDDKEYILDILKNMIETLGYTAILAEKSDEAIRIIQEDYRSGRMIKACILDQTLPGDLHGNEVAQKIYEIFPELPLIASSGYSDSDVMIHPQKYHFVDCISKPFDSLKLSKILHCHL